MEEQEMYQLTEEILQRYVEALVDREYEVGTIRKYESDINKFIQYIGKEGRFNRETVRRFKRSLWEQHYEATTINGILTAMNGLFLFLEYGDMRVRLLNIQKQSFRDQGVQLNREDYQKLVAPYWVEQERKPDRAERGKKRRERRRMAERRRTAERREEGKAERREEGKSWKEAEADGPKNHTAGRRLRETTRERSVMISVTISCMGLRVSELPSVTVEALGCRYVSIYCKGKSRRVPIPKTLRDRLQSYCKRRGIQSGPIFITSKGKCVHRSSIWRELQCLARSAGVELKKAHPHNFRHFFACTYYQKHRDLVGLSSILGHSNINTTRIYAALSAGECEERMESLGLAAGESPI